MIVALPEFEGYTVDVKLKQFRKVDRSKPSIEFIYFDSEEGDKILGRFIESLDANMPEDKEILSKISGTYFS